MKFAPTSKKVHPSWNTAFWNHQPFEVPESRELMSVPVGTFFYLDEASQRVGWRSRWVLWNGKDLASVFEQKVPATLRTWVLINGPT